GDGWQFLDMIGRGLHKHPTLVSDLLVLGNLQRSTASRSHHSDAGTIRGEPQLRRPQTGYVTASDRSHSPQKRHPTRFLAWPPGLRIPTSCIIGRSGRWSEFMLHGARGQASASTLLGLVKSDPEFR